MPAPQLKSRIYVGHTWHDVREGYGNVTSMVTNSASNEYVILTNEVGLHLTVRIGSIDLVQQLPEGYVPGPKP
jgi:hypothetical protein